MIFFDTILTTLKKPFPEQESNFGALRTIAIISVFVTFFLYIFQPFGFSTIKSGLFLICLGFGGVTFVASVIYDFIVGPLLKLKGKQEHWTFGKWIVYNLGVMLFISLANFLFARILIFGYIQWDLLPHMIYGTFMIGVIPIIALGVYSLIVQEKKYQSIAEKMNHQETAYSGDNLAEEQFLFDIPVSCIKYVEALQNYVSIGYVDSADQYKKLTERATLKQILEETSGSSIIKSHRSFLVNRKAIISISGNAQGLLLKLSDCEKIIPVSRSYIPVFRNK